MAYLIPPMDDEPPPDFIAFVAGRQTALRSETARLVGGERFAPEVYMEVLTDLAGHWRRLCWRSRVSHQDAITEYLRRRLETRTKQWREDQIYPVEVSVLRQNQWPPEPVAEPVTAARPTWEGEQARQPIAATARTPAGARPLTAAAAAALYERAAPPPAQTVARQLAPLLPTTARAEAQVVADAEIAWVHAYRRYVWRRYCRVGGGIVLLIGYMVQFMSQVSAPT